MTLFTFLLAGLYLAFGLYKILFHFEAFSGSQSSLYSPLPRALPALLQYYRTSIAQDTTPPRPLLCVLYTLYNIGNGNIV